MDDVPSKAEKPSLKSALRLHFRILTFQATEVELTSLGSLHLAMGLVWTWVAGIGRWWDDPGANPLQHLGLGSVAYVFLLSLVLWLVALPLRPKSLTYLRTLTFVTLTAPPAMLYALPVERWWGLDTATTLNVWFLGLVAILRVSLYHRFLVRGAGLTPDKSLVATLLPVMLTIEILTMLNLERATIQVMGGLRDPSAADGVFSILILLSGLSLLGSLVMVPIYLAEIYFVYRETRRAKTERADTSQSPSEVTQLDGENDAPQHPDYPCPTSAVRGGER